MSRRENITKEQWDELFRLAGEAHETAQQAIQAGRENVTVARSQSVDAIRELIKRQWETIEVIESKDWHTARAGAFEDLEYMGRALGFFLGLPGAGNLAPNYFDGERRTDPSDTESKE